MLKRDAGRSQTWAIVAFLAIAVAATIGVVSGTVLADVRTDKADYPPGATVYITGDGMDANETVLVDVYLPDGSLAQSHGVFASSTGAFQDAYVLPGIDDPVDGTYTVVATGLTSGTVFTTTFTDGAIKIKAGSSAYTFTLTVTIYSAADCTGTASAPVNRTGVNHSPGLTLGVGNTASLKLQAAATSDQGGAFINWTSTAPFTDLGNRTICVNGEFNGNRTYFADYGAGTLTATPSATATNVPPTATASQTPVPPTATASQTPVPPTATASQTPVPPTPTATHTPLPPTATATHTPLPPTATNTATATNVPPTATNTATATDVPPTATNTATATDVPPTATATPTGTNVPPTATNTTTATTVPPTATETVTGTPTGTPGPAKPGLTLQGADGSPLQNLWLCNQPGTGCTNKAAGVEEVNLNVDFTTVITSPEPKCVGFPGFHDPATCAAQKIGSFEFEVRYQAKYVSITIDPGTLFQRSDALCATTAGEGFIQFRCNLKGKPADAPTGPGNLAIVRVRPTADVYSMLVPSQDNGIATQLINQDCNVSDLQGHPIFTSVCGDADITIRYLEGDVHADCVVDIHDQQQIAFRWGSHTGQLLYNSRYDMEPSAPKLGDGDIDVGDLQMVFGRHESTCKAPHPPQPPIDPKAKVEPPLG